MEGDFLIRSISNLNASYIYEAAGVLAYWIAGMLTGPILFFSILWRIKGEVLGSVAGGTKWLSVIQDFTVWGIVLFLYFSLCQMVFDGFNLMYTFADALGGIDGTLSLFQEYYNKALTVKADRDWVDTMTDMASMPMTGASVLFYNVTLTIFIAAKIILSWAQAVAFSSAFYWGLIAIPLSLKSEDSSKYIKPWATFFTASLLWPIIDGFTLWLVSMGFTTMFDNMSVQFGSGTVPFIDLASVYNLFSIIHIVLIVFMGASFMIVAGLTTTGSVAGLNGMAMGGALAVGAMAYSGMKKGGGMLNRTNLSKADQALRGAGGKGMELASQGLGAVRDSLKTPKPNNGYSFVSANSGTGSSGSGGSGGGGAKEAAINPYLSGEEKLQGGSKVVSGYGGLGKGKEGHATNSSQESTGDKTAPKLQGEKVLKGGAKEVSGYGDLGKGKPKTVKTSSDKKANTSQPIEKKSKIHTKAKSAVSGSYADSGGSSEDKPPPKRTYTKEQKRARKAYFVKKTKDSQSKDN